MTDRQIAQLIASLKWTFSKTTYILGSGSTQCTLIKEIEGERV